jgi:hypothetical protein
MGENSKVVADEIIDDRASQKKSSIISMLKGKAMFYVVRLFKHKTVSATVKTPTAVMGVRGTKFGVEVRKTGEKFADLSDKGFIYLAQNEPGNFETVVYGFDGEVEVNSPGDGSKNNVGAGETLIVDNLGAGDVGLADPNMANRFVQDTEGGAITSGIGGTPGAGPGGVNLVSAGDIVDNYSESLAQTLTGMANGQPLGASGPINRMGYFTAMLTHVYSGINHEGTFMTDALKDFRNPEFGVLGDLAVDPLGYEMKVNWNNEKLTYINSQYSVNVEYPINSSESGHNAYMEWGYWTQTTPMPVSPGVYGDYKVDNKGYYLVGDNTSDIDMGNLNSLTSWWLYSGGAEGTYWTNTGGTDMTGTFDAKVNFNTNAIEEFNLSVAGGVHSASVTGASGSFVVNQGQTSHFGLGGGTMIYIDGAPGTFTANGSVYGPAAQSMGGVWSIADGVSQNAAGIFHGDQQGVTTPPAGGGV